MLSVPSPRPRLGRRNTEMRNKNVVMTSQGRAPWYGPDGKVIEAYVIGIAGGSASGKTSVARSILSALNNVPTVLILSQDSFYRSHSPEEIALAFSNDLDLDHPDALDTALFVKCLSDLKQGKATEIPVYSFVHHRIFRIHSFNVDWLITSIRTDAREEVFVREGIMALQTVELRGLYDLKVFVNCDSDLMLARRIKRDVTERGRQVDGILDQYLRFVKSSYDNFVQPSSKFADLLAIELLVTHVKRQLDSRSLRFRNKLATMGQDEEREGSSVAIHRLLDGEQPPELETTGGCVLLKQTNQLLGIMTILRDQHTERGDFIFYADRLSTLVVEKALELIPYRGKTVKAPTGASFRGLAKTDEEVVGISILRSGGPFSHGLRRVLRDVPIGAMLIQSDPKTGEPLLLSSDLPQSVKSGQSCENVRVLLLDSQMGTGAAAMMAIRVLLDHGVPESNIIFLAYIIARRGSQSVHRAFPKVKIVTAAIDTGLEEMRVPLTSPFMGIALAEADYATRLVSDDEDADDGVGEEASHGKMEEVPGVEAFKLPVKKGTEDLMFSRRTRADAGIGEKRAWAISPGMGHIGDRYYTI